MYLPDTVITTNSGKTLEIVALIRMNNFTKHLVSADWPAQNSSVHFLYKLHETPPRSACTSRQGSDRETCSFYIPDSRAI